MSQTQIGDSGHGDQGSSGAILQLSDRSVAVLMSVYNAAEYLHESIPSILQQSFKDFEFLIIDDGSSDNSAEILKHYAQQDNRIRVERNEKNLGLTRSLNKGLSLLSGATWIVRMDADDIAMKDRIEQQLQFLQANPHVRVLGTAVQIFQHQPTNVVSSDSQSNSSAATSSSPSPLKTHSNDRVIAHPTSCGMVRWSLPFYCPLAHPTVVFHRPTIVEAGGYSQSWRHCEDYELWLRLQRANVPMANLSTPLLRLRKHASNVSSLRSSGHIQQHHANLAVQHHLTTLLEAPICLSLVQALRTGTKGQTNTSSPSLGRLWTLLQLLQAMESECVGANFRLSVSEVSSTESVRGLSKAEKDEIRSDCTSRMGEIVVKSMKIVATPSVTIDDDELQVAARNEVTRLVAAGEMPSFSVDNCAPESVSSSTLMQQWMKRGPEAAMLLAKLMK